MRRVWGRRRKVKPALLRAAIVEFALTDSTIVLNNCLPQSFGGFYRMHTLMEVEDTAFNHSPLESVRQQVKDLTLGERVELLQDLLGEAACRHIGVYPIPA